MKTGKDKERKANRRPRGWGNERKERQRPRKTQKKKRKEKRREKRSQGRRV